MGKGIKDQLEIDITRGRFIPGDLFLLCSDGLTDMISEENIKDILLYNESLGNRTTLLVEQAKTNGGRDNITVVLVGVEK